MSDPDLTGPTRYGDIVVVGGGCYGGYYVRQLRRARAAGALAWDRLLVVDRDPACAVARAEQDARANDAGHDARTIVVTRDWTLFFHEYLAGAAGRGVEAVAADAIVPSPLMPHLMSQWLVARARRRWPGRGIRLAPLDGAVDVPWQRPGADGTHYVSFATWECPINCVEPRRCPHTRGARAWSLPTTVRAFVETARLAGRRIDGPAVLHCTHRAYGVGMFGVADVLRADALVADAAAARAAEVLVGTVSHCHGALSLLALAAPD
ncbi:MAG: hypothetical protein K1X31_11925 [Gemmatimonadaceae bacterium]|nr:hypothetical protein [Gemmatimonadaceae bacterium]